MGVSRVPGTDGATMGPPADRLYAVEPDGVAMISPSACKMYSLRAQTGRQKKEMMGAAVMALPACNMYSMHCQRKIEQKGLL